MYDAGSSLLLTEIQPQQAVYTDRRLAWKVFVVCSAYATLFFENSWSDLLDRSSDFYRKYAVTWTELGAQLLMVLLLAVILSVPVYWALRGGKPWQLRLLKWASLAALWVPVNVLLHARQVVALLDKPIRFGWKLALGGALAALLLPLVYKWETIAIPLLSTGFTILSPLLLLLTLSVAWQIYRLPAGSAFPDRPQAAFLPQPPGAPRLVWFVFDEWDQGMTFDYRPPGIELPELDRFRSEAFHADRAYPPSRETVVTIPSLLTGNVYAKETHRSPMELRLTYGHDGAADSLSSTPTVFSEARHAGRNIGITGSYLPYCRLFEASACWWTQLPGFAPQEWDRAPGLLQSLRTPLRKAAPMVPLMRSLGLVRILGDPAQITFSSFIDSRFREIEASAMRQITDKRLNLVFVHLYIPHPPGIYDARQDRFADGPGRTYVDNLRLVDRTFLQARRQLEAADLWDRTTVLLSADHPFRKEIWDTWDATFGGKIPYQSGDRVPFLLKLAGQRDGYSYQKPIQTIATKDLVLAILNGTVSQTEQVAAWLERASAKR